MQSALSLSGSGSSGEEDEVVFDRTALLNSEHDKALNSFHHHPCRRIITASLCIAFFVLGVSIAMPGPTLIDLSVQIGRLPSDLQVSYLFTGRSIGYLIGSILSGLLFDKMNQLLFIALCTAVWGVGLLAVARVHLLPTLVTAFSVQGLAAGSLDTSGNVLCLAMWPSVPGAASGSGMGAQSAAGPYMQALHFSFGVGAFVAPLLVQPFLSNTTWRHPEFDIVKDSEKRQIESSFAPNFNASTQPKTRNRRSVLDELKALNQTSHVNESLTTTAVPVSSSPKPHKPQTINAHRELSRNGRIADGSNLGKRKKEIDSRKKLPVHIATTTPSQTLNRVTTCVPKQQFNVTEDATVSVKNNLTSSDNYTDARRVPLAGNFIDENGTALTCFVVVTKRPTTPVTTMTTTLSTTPVVTTSTTSTTASTTTTSTSTTTTAPPPPTAVLSSTQTTTSNSAAINFNSNSSSTSMNSSDVNILTPSPVTTPADIIGTITNLARDIFGHSTVQTAYVIVGCSVLAVALLFLLLCCCARQTKDKSSRYDALRGTMDAVGTADMASDNIPLSFRVKLLTLLFAFFFVYVGMEITYGSFALTYAVSRLGWSKTAGAHLTAVYWGFFAAFRGLAVLLARCVSPTVLLIGDLIVSVASISTLVLGLHLQLGLTSQTLDLLPWICSAGLGAGLASVFPTGLTWAQMHMPITGKAAALVVVASALGEMTLPVLTGQLVQNQSPDALLYVMSAGTLACCLLFALLCCVASGRMKHQSRLRCQQRRARHSEIDPLEMKTMNDSSTSVLMNGTTGTSVESPVFRRMNSKQRRILASSETTTFSTSDTATRRSGSSGPLRLEHRSNVAADEDRNLLLQLSDNEEEI